MLWILQKFYTTYFYSQMWKVSFNHEVVKFAARGENLVITTINHAAMALNVGRMMMTFQQLANKLDIQVSVILTCVKKSLPFIKETMWPNFILRSLSDPKCLTTTRQTCVFPYLYGGKLYHSCYDGWRGNWCPTSLNSDQTYKDWDFCVIENCSEEKMIGIPIIVINKNEI